MLDHLYAVYGKMTPQDLQQLDEDMKQPYDPHLPIENLFNQIENVKDLAQAANAPHVNAQLLNPAYNIIFQVVSSLRPVANGENSPIMKKHGHTLKLCSQRRIKIFGILQLKTKVHIIHPMQPFNIITLKIRILSPKKQ